MQLPDFNDPLINPLTWSILGMLCLLPLIAEAASFTRVLFITHQRLWRYIFVALPLGVSLWLFGIAWNALNFAWNTIDLRAGTISLYAQGDNYVPARIQYQAGVLFQVTNAYQLQAAVTLVAFVLMLVLERRLLPRVKRPPVWVLRRERAI